MKAQYVIWRVIQGVTSPERPLREMRQPTMDEVDPWRDFWNSVPGLKCDILSRLQKEPDLVYEGLWPQLRNWLHRQAYTITFETPLRIVQKITYELVMPIGDVDNGGHLYIGSLASYLPQLEITFNNEPQIVLKIDEITELVLVRLRSLAEMEPFWTRVQGEATRDQIYACLRAAVSATVRRSVPEFISMPTGMKPGTVGKLIVQATGVPPPVGARGGRLLFSQDCSDTPKLSQSCCWEYETLDGHFARGSRLVDLCEILFRPVPLRQPSFALQVYSKCPSGSVWVYIHAPDNFGLRLDYAQTNSQVVDIHHVSHNDPGAACIRIGPRGATQQQWQALLAFRVVAGVNHKLWLWAIEIQLFLLGLLYCIGISGSFRYFDVPAWVSSLAGRCSGLVHDSNFFAAAITIMSFITIARGWLFFEETVFRLMSIRFTILLIILAVLTVVGLLV